MVSNTLELKSFKMRDEAVKENTLSIANALRKMGMSEEQIKIVIEISKNDVKKGN